MHLVQDKQNIHVPCLFTRFFPDLQVVLLQQQLEERDRTIRLLQQQLAQSLASQKTTCISTDAEAPTNTVNAATQTERSSRPTLTGSSLSRAASIDDGLGPTVR